MANIFKKKKKKKRCLLVTMAVSWKEKNCESFFLWLPNLRAGNFSFNQTRSMTKARVARELGSRNAQTLTSQS